MAQPEKPTKIDKDWREIPLLKAAAHGDTVQFKKLLAKGESPNICDEDGWTAADWAAFRGSVEILKVIDKSLLITTTDNGELPAHFAARGGSVEVFEYLKTNNISITTPNNNGDTPLHTACLGEKMESIKWFSKNQSAEQFNVSNKLGQTPLMVLQDKQPSYSKERRAQCLKLLQKERPDLFDNKTEHWKAFGNAVKMKGSLSLYAVQCMSIGLPRVGKTCLYYRIRNEQPPGQPTTRDTPGQGSASTGVLADRKMIQVKIDLDRRTTKGKAIITGDDGWKEVDTLDEEIQIYIKSIYEQQQQQQQQSQDSSLSQTSDTNNSSSPSSIPIPSTTSESFNTPTDEETNKSSPPQLDLSLIDDIMSNMKEGGSGNIDEVKALLKKSLSIFYTDCGGQPEFCEVLPALVAGPTIFMLAFSLCEPLDSLYKVRYESSLSQIAEYESSYTVKEMLMKCLSSILSFHHSQSKSYQHLQSTASQYAKFTPPPTNAITVATHRDLVDEKTITEVDKKLQDCVRNTALEKEGIIEYNTPERLIIPIDNYSEEDGPVVREVFDRIVMRENEDGESPYKVEIPIPWLGLDLFLRQQSSAVVSYDECLAFYAKLGMEPATLTSCLWFLHHQMGTIRYYNDIKGLEDIVIADPSVIFMAATEFIVATFTLKNVSIDVERKYHKYGLFKKKDVEHIFNKHKDKLQINLHQFVALFEHLNILGPAHSKDFDHFLPAALVHAPFSEDSKSLSAYDPLMASFPIGFIALGVYSGLLAHVCSVNGWELMCDSQSGMPRIFRDQATFIAHDAPVTIKATAKHLEFVVDYKINGGICEIYSKVRNDLEIALHNVLNRLGYSEEFTLGFRCSTCISDCNEYHFAEVIGAEKPTKAKCLITKMPFLLKQERMLWFNAFKLGSFLHPVTTPSPHPPTTITTTATERGDLPISFHDSKNDIPDTTDDCTPQDVTDVPSAKEILRKYSAQVCEVVSNTTKLGNDLVKATLITGHVMDSIETNYSLCSYAKVNRYMTEIRHSLQTVDDNLTTIKLLCGVLQAQGGNVKMIGDSMLTDLDIQVHVPLNGALQTSQRKRNHSDCDISVDDPDDAKKHHDDVSTSSNTSSGEGCVLTQKRKNDISEDNGTTLKKRCNDNVAIEDNTNILIPLDVDKLQNLLIEKDDELMMLKQKLTKPLPTIKEQSTQFNYMIPVNDCLDNVHVGDETVYLIQGSHTQSFNWTRWGIRMYFSDNTVASDETCEVAVKALVGGKFLFPNGSQLISAVYAISFARKLAKPVRLEIQHCALLKAESQLKYLSFVKAPMKQRIPPFEFSPLEGGSFYLDSQYGSIILDHFSLIGIIKNVAMYIYSYIPFPNSQTENEEAFDTQLSYTGQLYYTQHGNNANQWIARFMAVKDLEAFKMFIEKSYPDSVSDQTVSFSFDNDDKTLELVMNSQQDKPTTGWELLPHARPLKLLKDQMDLFGSSDCIPDPPTCMITILATPGTKTQSSLNYCIPIKGVVSVTEQICIIRLLESSSIVPSVTTPQQDQRLSSPPATTDDVPISDIINCIKGELQKSISDLTELFDTRLEKITTELLAVGLVSEYAVNSHPTSTALIKEYRAGFSFITTIVQLTERCHKFFNAMYKIRGGFSLAADTLKERINKSLMEKFNITLDL